MPPTSSPSTSELLERKRPIILSGPSGSGKSTLIGRLSERFPNTFGFSISHTTRQPRGAEKNGVEYHFIAIPEFEAMIADDKFVENAKYGSNYYGTSKSEITRIRGEGQVPMLDIEMEGVKQVQKDKELGALTRYCSVQAPSLELLEKRLRGRGTDSEEAVGKRLEQARKEMEFAKQEGSFEKILINDEVDRAYEEFEKWVLEG